MEPVYLFNLIDRQKSWLSTRQSLVAQNVANINTPGYKALDALPFARVMERSALEMAGANPLHMRPAPGETMAAATKPADGWETTHAGNTVSPEQEMIKAGEIRGAFSLGTNLQRSFHSMWMSTVRT
ncbi:flagellar basal body protein [Methylocystis echinoides]|jgi:flagellar basal-body rod protein FlgB|uniref:Flagellar biosynthesis protein FlgB n=1 Tax=Methylocystis echinoides TaxID=29468 RepID=A0A9W6GSM4_9HYPH|nr:flagellar basal body protein [Methylocystis echinoides]GLI92116.1 flagellar biosynthesis protein FlgB [Methylocystis echinoides]